MALLDKQQAKDILKTAKEKTADLIGDEGKELLTKAGKFVSDTGSKVTRKTADVIEKTEVREKATKAAEMLSVKAGEIKESAMEIKDDINDKIYELDHMLEHSVTDYNDAYTIMSDNGIQLYIERCRASDLIGHIETLVNSIANRPKSFDTEFEEIKVNRSQFKDSCDFANRELQIAREAAGGAGAGLAAGASVAFMAPTAAMWVATTFGTASTGAAISTLSGAAATNAALAWLGGGAAAAGGGGMAAGHALLAMAGPVGWTIAGATLLSSIIIFSSKRTKLNKQKNEEIEVLKNNIESVKELSAQIGEILGETNSTRLGLSSLYSNCLTLFGANYAELNDAQKKNLGALVNNTKALSALFGKTVIEQGGKLCSKNM